MENKKLTYANRNLQLLVTQRFVDDMGFRSQHKMLE